ncbi:MAG: hypothetical protein L3J15_05855 [Devosiaceae bacterium]|nr:hypothetical protein [Devosiaceae bacterium]
MALPISLIMWAGIAYAAVTLRDMINDSRYWPKPCIQTTCTLTGLGGVVGIWTSWVDGNSGKTFL